MPSKKTKKENIAAQLFEIGAIQFGKFTLKSGIESPFYIDLRRIVAYPQLLSEISELFYEKMRVFPYSQICGVPYTALPIATAISLKHDIPMLMKRKEAKDYGTKKMIEGVYKPNEQVIIIEDIATSGKSVFETITALNQEGLTVQDVIVLVDRMQGASENLKSKGYHLHSVYTLTELLDYYVDHNFLSKEMKLKVENFVQKTSLEGALTS